MELACYSIPVVAAEVAGPSPAVEIVAAAGDGEAARVERVAREAAGPSSAARAAAVVVVVAVEEPAAPSRSGLEEQADSTPAAPEMGAATAVAAGPSPAVGTADSSRSASRVVVRRRRPGQHVQHVRAGRCEYVARCRGQPARPLLQ
jgi:hypothetical protein